MKANAARKRPVTSHIRNLRRAVADYMCSEGCGCCRDNEAHKEHKARIAKLLRVPRYKDRSGFNFPRFRSKW